MTFIAARLSNQSVPTSWEVPVLAGEEFEIGALGFLTDGEFEEAGADPAVGTITHVSMTPFGAAASVGAHFGTREFPPGYAIVVEAFATTFRCEYTGSLPAAPGASYGVVRGADAKWRIAFGDTVAPLQVRYLGPVNEFPNHTPRYVEVEFVAA